MTNSEISDEDWLLGEIWSAQSIERLEFIGRSIADDAVDGAPYTRDERWMELMRGEYRTRMEELRNA